MSLAASGMTYLNVVFMGFALFFLTGLLCVLCGFLLQVSPLLAVLALFVGTLAVVLTVDVLQAFLFG